MNTPFSEGSSFISHVRLHAVCLDQYRRSGPGPDSPWERCLPAPAPQHDGEERHDQLQAGLGQEEGQSQG